MDYLRTIQQKDFAKLWVAQVCSQVAANLLNFALIIVVYNLTLGSRFASFAVSLLVLSFAIPSIFAAPAAGKYVDFWDRKKILVISNLLRVGLALLYIVAAKQLVWILVLTFVTASITQFFLPAEASTIPRVVPPRLLLVANSLFVFSMYAAFLVGFSASGPAIVLLGDNGAYIATAVLFGIATLLTIWLPKQEVPNRPEHLPPLHLWRQFKENWSIVRGHPDRYFALMQMGVIQGIVFVFITLAPALSMALLHVPLQRASHVLILPVGIGMVMGVLLIYTLTQQFSKVRIVQASFFLAALMLILLGLTGQLNRLRDEGSPIVSASTTAVVVSSIVLVLGMLNALISTAAQTLLQETTDDKNRGKVFGSLQMLINVFSTAPVFVAGILADLISVTKVTILLGIFLMVYTVQMVRRYRGNLPGPVQDSASSPS